MSAHTPGPWRWEVNLKSKQIQLCGGRPQFDLTVVDFTRWGMGGARPRFLEPSASLGLMLLQDAEKYAVVVPGREHHKEWFQGLKHPDANLIEAAPNLLAALKTLRLDANTLCDRCLGGTYEDDCRAAIEIADLAIAKAEGR